MYTCGVNLRDLFSIDIKPIDGKMKVYRTNGGENYQTNKSKTISKVHRGSLKAILSALRITDTS